MLCRCKAQPALRRSSSLATMGGTAKAAQAAARSAQSFHTASCGVALLVLRAVSPYESLHYGVRTSPVLTANLHCST